MKVTLAAASAALALCAQPALAQIDGPGLLFGWPETLGTAAGSSNAQQASIFVTGRGVSDRPEGVAPVGPLDRLLQSQSPQGYYHTVTVARSAATAVEADRARDAAVERLRGIARAAGAQIRVESVPFTFGATERPSIYQPGMDAAAMQEALRVQREAAAAPPEQVNAASAVTFFLTSEDRMPALIDQVTAVGVTRSAISMHASILGLGSANSWLDRVGLGVVEYPDNDPRFRTAMREAVEQAQRQARDLADGAAVRLGSPINIVLLTRTLVDEQAVVVVGIRYAIEAR